ncbi:hypothetical protein TYRP_014102 [Tyrophagus putrescentiae]|nr:hypothetical protein TYRP_014102 [Tyrophagus putrescentiae]
MSPPGSKVEKTVHSLLATVSSVVESPRFSFLHDVQQIVVSQLQELEEQMKLVAETAAVRTDCNQMRYKLFQVHHFGCWLADLKLPRHEEALMCGEVKAAIRRKLKCLQTVLSEVEVMLAKGMMMTTTAAGDITCTVVMNGGQTQTTGASPEKHVTFAKAKTCSRYWWTRRRIFWLIVFTAFWLTQLYLTWPYLSEVVPVLWASLKSWLDDWGLKDDR